MTDEEPTKSELMQRLERLEQHIFPNRRDVLRAGVGAAVGGAAAYGATGGAAAGSQSAGVIGTQSEPQDAYLEDVYDANGNNPLTLPGDGSVSIADALINNNRLYVQGTAPSNPSAGDIWIDTDG